MQHRFEKADEWAPVFDDPGRDAWQRPAEVVKLAEIAPGMTVADLGAGTGYFVPHLSRAVGATGRVLALDVEADMVRYLGERIAREKLENAVAQQVPVDDPLLPEGQVQCVLVVDTWHHLSDRPAYASKLARGLAPGGRVVVVDFTLESQLGPPVQHRLRPEQVADDLRAGGLEPRILDEILPEQYVVVGVKGSRPTTP
jgi:ubiquinone/menaquinone biosynthesis C-methylase UbiE